MLDQLRSAARYLYAINQSPAKLVLDPIYSVVAGTLLGETPQSAELLAHKYPQNLYVAYRKQSRKLHYYIEDWNFAAARPDLLTERQRRMMHTVALGETSGAAVAAGFLHSFRTLPELAAFFGTWFVEELNHFMGYHLYLDRMGEAWSEQRGLEVARVEFRPYAEDPMEVAACNMYQELVGYLIYRSFASQAGDPFLARMVSQFAKDELRHFKFYQGVVARHVQSNPDFRKVVVKVFLKATSPFNQVSGGPSKVIENLRNGVFYFRRREFDFFVEQLEYLTGKNFAREFGWFFKGHIEPCDQCGNEVFLCECERFENVEAPQKRAPRRTDASLPLWAQEWVTGAMNTVETRA